MGNGELPTVTERVYHRIYALYPGKVRVNDTPEDCRGCMTAKIKGLGRSVSKGYGYRNKALRLDLYAARGENLLYMVPRIR